MAKNKKQPKLPTQGEILANTRRLEALRSGQQFTDKKKAKKADKVGRKQKYKNGE